MDSLFTGLVHGLAEEMKRRRVINNEVASRLRSLACFLISAVTSSAIHAHGIGPWARTVNWHADHIVQVITNGNAGRTTVIDGKACLLGRFFQFKVDNEYAFDIDETVWLDMRFYVGGNQLELKVAYDSDGIGLTKPAPLKKLSLPEGSGRRWYAPSIPQEHVRFTDLGLEGSDFSIAAADFEFAGDRSEALPNFTLCDLTLRRTYATPVKNIWRVSARSDRRERPGYSRAHRNLRFVG